MKREVDGVVDAVTRLRAAGTTHHRRPPAGLRGSSHRHRELVSGLSAADPQARPDIAGGQRVPKTEYRGGRAVVTNVGHLPRHYRVDLAARVAERRHRVSPQILEEPFRVDER